MRFHALACDYDGTIAADGVVDEATFDALVEVAESGRRLVMVTGRQVDDLLRVFPGTERFDVVVAENGAVLYLPGTRETRVLAEPPPDALLQALTERGVEHHVGEAIVATWQPHEAAVLDVIRELGLELEIVFNKGAVMVLPTGVTKASGLRAAVQELGLTAHEVVGVGDAENDHAFLAVCECAVAVANALDSVRERCDLVTDGARGAGIQQLARRLVDNDLADLELARHDILLGHDGDGHELRLSPARGGLVVAGTSGSGKSSLVGGFLERLSEDGYQFCLVDPEGDYQRLGNAILVGGPQQPPAFDQVTELLARPGQSVIVSLLGVGLDNRPSVFEGLMPIVAAQRAATGRPHWLAIDEAHHLLPPQWQPGPEALPRAVDGVLLVSVHPDWISPEALRCIDVAVGVGESAEDVLATVAAAHECPPPAVPAERPEGSTLLWDARADAATARALVPAEARAERARHRRKYAEGELPEERSFFFRGPDDRLALRAQNLILFLQLGDGVDDETWLFHLRRGDYSGWIREMIKDEELADEAATVEQEEADDPRRSRERIRELVEERYTLPARKG